MRSDQRSFGAPPWKPSFADLSHDLLLYVLSSFSLSLSLLLLSRLSLLLLLVVVVVVSSLLWLSSLSILVWFSCWYCVLVVCVVDVYICLFFTSATTYPFRLDFGKPSLRGWRNTAEAVLFEISNSMKPYPSVSHAYINQLRPVICLFKPKHFDELSNRIPPTSQLPRALRSWYYPNASCELQRVSSETGKTGVCRVGADVCGCMRVGLLGREILYTTTSWKQFQRLQMCQNRDKSLYTPPPLGGGGGGG